MHSGSAAQAARRLFTLSAQHPAQRRAFACTTAYNCRPALATTALAQASACQRRGHSDGQRPPAAAPRSALMLIGDEILSGAIQDTNSPWLAKLLYSRGVDLIRGVTIPDDPNDISETLQDLKRRVGEDGVIFTSGGIGPTHDDVTYEGVARAFGVTLQKHAHTIDRMLAHYGKRGLELNEARLRMATLPHPAQVLFSNDLWVPLVVIQGVYVLPGIPRLFKQMLEANVDTLPRGPAHVRREFGTLFGEGDIAMTLKSIADKHPKVRIGSYPTDGTHEAPYKVLLRLEGRDEKTVATAADAVANQFKVFDV